MVRKFTGKPDRIAVSEIQDELAEEELEAFKCETSVNFTSEGLQVICLTASLSGLTSIRVRLKFGILKLPSLVLEKSDGNSLSTILCIIVRINAEWDNANTLYIFGVLMLYSVLCYYNKYNRNECMLFGVSGECRI